jgi:(p)ppGpp synthase/HD superfamily hydrolase
MVGTSARQTVNEALFGMTLSPRFSEALLFAASLHQNQNRKGATEVPYISHLILVAGTVLEYGGTENQAIAGLLHDAVEDQGGGPTRSAVYRLFGPEVGAIVDACTDSDEIPKPPWRARKEEFVASLAAVPIEAHLVILADKLSNVRSTIRDLREIGAAVFERFKGKRDGTLWYYRSIQNAVNRDDPRVRSLATEFDRAVDEMESLAAAA